MRVLFLPTNVAGVNFWRMKQFSDRMKDFKVNSFIYGYNDTEQGVAGWEQRFLIDQKTQSEIYSILNACDVAVVQYVHVPMVFALVLMYQEEFKKKMICEIDDEVIDTPDYNPAAQGGWKLGNPHIRVVIEHLKASNGIVTSTDYLKEYYTKYNKRIDVIPNSIDFRKWNVKNAKHKGIRVGWIGGGNHEEDLQYLRDVIPEVMKRHPEVEFHIVHGVPSYLKGLKGVKWTTEWQPINKYPEFVASRGFDIGLAPLTTNRFNMAKSNLRWLEYSALGIPTIASKIEPYEKSIKHGKNGYLCSSSQEWIDSICDLIENEKTRRQFGDNSKELVHKNFDLDKVTRKYIKVLKGYV